jgi:hypothetical protein
MSRNDWLGLESISYEVTNELEKSGQIHDL